MRFLLPALTVLVLAQQAPPAAFVAQRDGAAAMNPASPRFTIALPLGHRAFRVGERIPIVFAYDNLTNHSLSDERRPYTHFARPVIDRIDGTARPDADLARARLFISGGVCCGSPGGVVGGAFMVSPPRFAGLAADGSPIIVYPPQLRLEPPPTHLLPLERKYVLTRDDAADERVVDGAVSVLERSTDASERAEAARTLGYVGSPRAIGEMARRLYADQHPQEENYYLAAGLFAVRDRALAIASMEAQIDDPKREVTAYYCQTLAALQLVTRTTERLTSAEKINALRAVEIRRLRVLARAGDAAAERALKERTAAPRQQAQHLGLPVMDDFQDAAEAYRIYARYEVGGWVYYVNDGQRVSFQRLDAQLRRYPRGTVFRWTDNVEDTLQSWYIDTDAEIARVAAVLAKRGIRITR